MHKIHLLRTNRPAQFWTGLLLFLIGLPGDCISGALLLHRADLRLFLPHVFSVLLWASGINLLCARPMPQDEAPADHYPLVNRWGIGALLLGLFTFPGSGVLTYSIALVLAALLRGKKGHFAQTPELKRTVENTSASEAAIQPVLAILQDADIEAKRQAITTLQRQGTPEAMRILRQLLLDPHAEIRRDASIALTQHEDHLSRSLNSSLQEWAKNPSDRTCVLNLADQYYQYAHSNVLDDASQYFYLVKAYDFLRSVTRQNATEPDLWLKLARTCRQLHKFEEALQAVRVALQLSPRLSDAYSLAMELALKLRDWNSLVAFAREGADMLPEASEVSESLQWWATLQAQQQGESAHA